MLYNKRAWYPGLGWETLIDEDNYETATDEAVDLVSKMLMFDHEFRITAKDAMEHPFFDSFKN